MKDISDKNELCDYIRRRKFMEGERANTELVIRYFSGGVSGTVAFVSAGERSFVVKQALPFLKVAQVWESDPKRMETEYKALKAYSRIVPQCVPSPLFYDEENFIMVREAAPESCVMWKAQLMDGIFESRVAEKAIKALLEIHSKTAGDIGIHEAFLDDSIFYSLRISPYIEKVAEVHPNLAAGAHEISKMLMSEKIALVHGDYSPKNILVNDAEIFIIDMEVAHYGHPAFDVAFFANHFLLKSVKYKQWAEAYLNMLRRMLDMYFAGAGFMDRRVLEKQTVQTLAYLFIARVDGKSPAEYITLEKDKQLIRDMAFSMLSLGTTEFDDVIGLLRQRISRNI